MADFIPGTDAAFDEFQKTLIAAIAADPAKYGQTAAQVAALQADQTAWGKAWPAHEKAKLDEDVASKTKATARTQFEADVRSAHARMKATPTVDDAARAAAGLKVMAPAHAAQAAPATRPIGRLEPGGHLTLILHFADEATPSLRAKPHGIHGAEIWSHVGDPAPADASGYVFVALDTRTPYRDDHAVADAGKSVQYLIRWQNRKGEHGPWSDVIVGKIPV